MELVSYWTFGFLPHGYSFYQTTSDSSIRCNKLYLGTYSIFSCVVSVVSRWSCQCRSRLCPDSRRPSETRRRRSALSVTLWLSRRTRFMLGRWSADVSTIPSRSLRQVPRVAPTQHSPVTATQPFSLVYFENLVLVDFVALHCLSLCLPLQGNIRVFCRVRPLGDGGLSKHLQLPASDNKMITLAKTEEVRIQFLCL